MRIIPGAGLASVAAGDARYIRRFVDVAGAPTLAGNTRTQVNAVAVTETVLENPTGLLQARIPSTINAVWLQAEDAGRVLDKLVVLRVGNVAIHENRRADGTYAAPTAVAGPGAGISQYRATAYDGAQFAVVGVLDFDTAEPMTAGARGTEFAVRIVEQGTTTLRNVVRYAVPSVGVMTSRTDLATVRIIAGSTEYAIRDSTNTRNALRVTAGGVVILGDGATPAQGPTVIDHGAMGAAAASVRFNGLTTGAAAQVGTLTNAPTAGNPTFWLPVNIAGAVRYIPCWT